MSKTALADIIIPTTFEQYAIERTAELSTFGQCGIVEHAAEFDALAAGGVVAWHLRAGRQARQAGRQTGGRWKARPGETEPAS